MALLRLCDFSTCIALSPGRHKTVTTPEIIDQIHELILKDRRISAKSIAEKREYHVSGLGPSFMKICVCEISSRNAWTRIKNVKCASGLSNIRNFDVEYIYGFVWWGVCKQSRWRHSVTVRSKMADIRYYGNVM